HVLDLARRDVLATAHDHVIEPAIDVQVAGVVEAAAVVGGKPTVVVRRPSPAQVLAGHLLASDPDLAALPRGDRPSVGVADLELEARQRLADRAQPGARHRLATGAG